MQQSYFCEVFSVAPAATFFITEVAANPIVTALAVTAVRAYVFSKITRPAVIGFLQRGHPLTFSSKNEKRSTKTGVIQMIELMMTPLHSRSHRALNTVDPASSQSF